MNLRKEIIAIAESLQQADERRRVFALIPRLDRLEAETAQRYREKAQTAIMKSLELGNAINSYDEQQERAAIKAARSDIALRLAGDPRWAGTYQDALDLVAAQESTP